MPTPAAQSDATFQEIHDRVWRHLEERDWHTNPPRGLAISIALEANELLEHYQWRDEPVGGKEELAEELADIFIYAFEFAAVNDIDIPRAIKAKLEKAAKKYPAKDFKGKTATERKKAWLQAKLNHKKDGL
jgi:NTP pyrophosphatase (non-canonical NTP hydrolase)